MQNLVCILYFAGRISEIPSINLQIKDHKKLKKLEKNLIVKKISFSEQLHKRNSYPQKIKQRNCG